MRPGTPRPMNACGQRRSARVHRVRIHNVRYGSVVQGFWRGPLRAAGICPPASEQSCSICARSLLDSSRPNARSCARDRDPMGGRSGTQWDPVGCSRADGMSRERAAKHFMSRVLQLVRIRRTSGNFRCSSGILRHVLVVLLCVPCAAASQTNRPGRARVLS